MRGPVFRTRLALSSGSILLLVSATAAAEEPLTTPSEPASSAPFVAETPPSGARGTLAAAGAGVFVGWYGVALGESFLWPDAPEANKLRIPVAGPWLTVAHAGCASGEAGCTDILAVVRAVVAGISAVGQVGGLLAIGEAAFLPTSTGAHAPLPKRALRVESVSVSAVGQGFGFGVSGHF